MPRDDLYELLKTHNIYGRRYFYPLISSFEPYCKYASAREDNLPIASKLANEVICLPMYAELADEDVDRVVDVVVNRV